MNKDQFMMTLQSAILHFDGMDEIKIISELDIDPRLAKAGTKLCLYLKSLEIKNRIPTRDLVIKAIHQLETDIGATTSSLIQHFSDDQGLMPLLEDMKYKGELFNPKPDIWKVLE